MAVSIRISVRTVARYFAAGVIPWIDAIAPRLNDAPADELAPVRKSELRAAFRDGLIQKRSAACTLSSFSASAPALSLRVASSVTATSESSIHRAPPRIVRPPSPPSVSAP